MERENFERSWRKAFEGAEITPSDKVWTNVELELEREKGGDLKRRLHFYQMLAAASIVFAMAIGGAGLYYSLDPQTASGTLATQTQEIGDQTPAAANDGVKIEGAVKQQPQDISLPAFDSSPTAPAVQSETGDNRSNQPYGEKTPALADNESARNPVSAAGVHAVPPGRAGSNPAVGDAGWTGDASLLSAVPAKEPLPDLPRDLDNRQLAPLYTPREIRLNIPSEAETVDPVVAMLARLEQREKEMQREEKNKRDRNHQSESLWTSIGFAAGSFNNMQSSASNPAPANTAMALAAQIVDQETSASGYSYSMGVNVGTRISERWVFQGGVNYLTQASEYTANNVVVSSSNMQQQRFRAASPNELVNTDALELSNKIVYSAPYNVNNSMRYLSLPLQAGYLVVNKTFGLQLNAGVATDLFLQNTVTADSDQLDKTSQAMGSDSPYRSLNFSGLLGTEFSYRFGEHYRVALNPGIRYPFSTIYKSQLGVQANPLSFDVGVRFRYIFR